MESLKENNSFVFYESFLQSISNLEEEEQGKMALMIINYGIYGQEPKLEGYAGAFWTQVKLCIDNAKKRRAFHKEIGAKGGLSKATKNSSDAKEIPSDARKKCSDATNNSSVSVAKCSDAREKSSEVYPYVNVNVNDNVNVNANVNDKVGLATAGGNNNKLNSDSIQEHLRDMGYEVSTVSCGQIASILNYHKLPLSYCEFVENKVSDRYPEISAGLMVNALSTWIELYDDFKKEQKQKVKKELPVLSKCVRCGCELTSLNWINGKHHCYFCTTCGTNFVRQKSGDWKEEEAV